jgi:hypothetical protein
LALKTIISLTPEHPIKPLLTFSRSSGIDFVGLPMEVTIAEVADEVVLYPFWGIASLWGYVVESWYGLETNTR